jgi:hypothetical protein
MGLQFRLEFDGRSFNLMPDTEPIPTGRVGYPPEEHIAEAVEQLGRLVAEESGGHLFSTLRSSHYEPDTEVQTLYAVQAGGTVQTEQRTVDAETAPPPAPVSPKEYVKTALMAVGVLTVLFAISALFVDYGQVWARLVETVKPTRAEDIDVDISDLQDMVAVADKEVKGSYLVVHLERGPDYPTAMPAAWRQAADQPRRRLALEAVLRGYLRAEYFGAKEQFLGHSTLRIKALEQNRTVELRLPLSRRARLHAVRLTY